MSIGQAAELATMAILGLVLKRLGWRLTMIFGILGHVVRFGIYSIANNDLLWLVILSNVAHGFAYAFFFATVYIYVDENFPKDIRTSAQSLFNLLILGFGPFLSNLLSPILGTYFKNADGTFNYNQLFLVPLGLGLLAALILAIFFHPKRQGSCPRRGSRPCQLRGGLPSWSLLLGDWRLSLFPPAYKTNHKTPSWNATFRRFAIRFPASFSTSPAAKTSC